MVTALPLFFNPPPWATGIGAAHLLDVPVNAPHAARRRRTRAWPLVHVVLSLTSGLLVVVCAGNTVATAASSEFTDALGRVAAGGTVMDPEVIAQLLARPAGDPIAALTPREREVLALMARGEDDTAIAARLGITQNAVHKHIGNIFAKLGLSRADGGHRRVLALLAYLDRTASEPRKKADRYLSQSVGEEFDRGIEKTRSPVSPTELRAPEMGPENDPAPFSVMTRA